MAGITRRDAEGFYYATNYNLPEDWLEFVRDKHFAPERGTIVGRTLLDSKIVHVTDVLADPEYTFLESAKTVWFRTVLGVPLMRGENPIGVLILARRNVAPFTAKQIDLILTFADQAVIAIQNVSLFDQVQARTTELAETLGQQTAIADALKVISRSTFELQVVLDTLAESVARLCEADTATVVRQVSGNLFEASRYGYSDEFDRYMRSVGHKPERGSVTGRVLLQGKTAQVADVLADPEYTLIEGQKLAGFRTVLGVPLLREGVPVGVFLLTRTMVKPFTDKQIELIETFADQAVIAIENVRLFEEVQAKTRDLEESLTFQKATSDVLEVIGKSASTLQPVLEVIVNIAADLCAADMSVVRLLKDGALHHAASGSRNDPALRALTSNHPALRIDRSSAAGRVALDAHTIHVPDVSADAELTYLGTLGNSKMGAVLSVPLLDEGTVAGTITLLRKAVGPFSARQIALVETFADQAVIAIKNARLFEEVQARTAELGEALQQQTATADVLKVISRSTFDLNGVLQALIDSAVALCNARSSAIFMLEDGVYRFGASYRSSPELDAHEKTHPTIPGRDSWVGRCALEKGVVHVPDTLLDSEYGHPEVLEKDEIRSVLCVPLMREGEPIGVFALSRPNPGPFTERQIELVKTFADQAVIAIENVRLFEEVQARTAEVSEALQQQTATADVLKVISRSAFDLQTVLETLVQSVARLCNAGHGLVFRRHGDVYRFAAGHVLNPEFERMERELEVSPGRGTAIGRALLAKQIVQIADALSDPEYEHGDVARAGNLRTVLAVPLLRQGEPIGAFGLSRDRVEPFTDREVELVRTFADQAVIAIENASLFEQVQAKTRDLEASLRDLRTAQDRLIQTEKLASLGQLTAGIAHEIKNPLNFVNNFASLSGDLLSELSEALDRTTADGSASAEIDELMTMLRGNLTKVEQHGRRADSIVKNMLLHSRQGSGEHRPTNINAVVEESLNLAYHGARAETQGFNITLERDFDPAAGEVDLYPQEITRVFLNLISNGFYATTKRRTQTNGAYEPVLAASTKDLGDRVEIRIRDNGTGIPPEVKEKMFNPFFTTKPAGEGTGLGLSLSHDIVVKQHAGTIEVSTEPGEFTEFRIVLPRSGASLGNQEAIA
jgi:GAF domain-containing protein